MEKAFRQLLESDDPRQPVDWYDVQLETCLAPRSFALQAYFCCPYFCLKNTLSSHDYLSLAQSSLKVFEVWA